MPARLKNKRRAHPDEPFSARLAIRASPGDTSIAWRQTAAAGGPCGREVVSGGSLGRHSVLPGEAAGAHAAPTPDSPQPSALWGRSQHLLQDTHAKLLTAPWLAEAGNWGQLESG